MAKVPLPERGQPLDVTYIYQLAEAVNDLSTQVSSATYNYTTVDTVSAGKQSVKTSEVRMIGGYVPVSNTSSVTTSSEKDFTYEFDGNFKHPPIVTATPVNTGLTPSGKNVTVVLTYVGESRVEGTVRFNSPGDLSVTIHLIILGIPN